MVPSYEFREDLAFYHPESWVQVLLDVSHLPKLPTHPGWVYATYKVRSVPGTVPYHKGYNLLLPTPKQIVISLPIHR